jgi:hypothetical protein
MAVSSTPLLVRLLHVGRLEGLLQKRCCEQPSTLHSRCHSSVHHRESEPETRRLQAEALSEA